MLLKYDFETFLSAYMVEFGGAPGPVEALSPGLPEIKEKSGI